MGRSPLKVQSCKLYNNKFIIVSTQIDNEIFAFIPVLVFKLLGYTAFFIKDNRKKLKSTVKK